MGIMEIYQRTNAAQQMTQQLAQYNTRTPMAGLSNAPVIPQASTYAILGELGVLRRNENFNINGTDRVNKLNKSQQLFRLGTVKSQYYNPLLNPLGFTGGAMVVNKNSSLSFMRGELGINMPLHEDALYKGGGRIAANLNIIG